MNLKDEKDRHTLWVRPKVWSMVEDHYRKDNCSKKNEYIEKAIRFYTGYLDTANASDYLPRTLSDMLEGKLDAMGSRMARLLFKLAVEQELNARILAALGQFNLDAVDQLRGKCIQSVKQTNGEIRFEDAVRSQTKLE